MSMFFWIWSTICCFTSGGGGVCPPKSFLAAMPTMPSAPITLISPPGQATIRSGS
jgi:hypothetical protein